MNVLRNGILLERTNEPIVTDGGFLLAKQPMNKPTKGKVLVTGPGNEDPIQCVPGDSILYNPTAAYPMSVDGVDYLYITENNLIAVL